MSALDGLLTIIGPTAAGKSALALELAKRLDGEIVSADSRQIYRRLDIGTAKPSPKDRASVPHHLIDILDPDEDYSLALFLGQASEAIQNVKRRNKLPILVGGTGQYVWALLEGWQVPNVPPDPELRRRLERSDPEALYAELTELAPAAAERIDPRNVRRVIRALEVEHTSPGSRPLREYAEHNAKLVGLTLSRSDLYERIDERIDAMVTAGWADEVRGLLEDGYDISLPSLSSLGYKEIVQSLRGCLCHDEAVRRIKSRTHQFARRQYGWFRLDDPRIRWFDASIGFGAIYAGTVDWLGMDDS